MSDTLPFAHDVVITATVGLAALLAYRVSAWVRVPASALLLVATAVSVTVLPGRRPSQVLVERVVTIALVGVLFSGGMSMGRERARRARVPIAVLGVPGTFATAAAAGAFVHVAFGFSWYASLLVGTAVAPTDPTVVFSVLGRGRVAGRSGTILEGESGANDPAGIALMAGLVGAGRIDASGAGHVATTFATQMAVGGAVGAVGGVGLLWLMRRVRMPGAGLEPLRTLVGAFLVYGVAAEARGSGFLAVFIAGVVIGGQQAPHATEIGNFHDALASLGEMAAFVALGLTVHLSVLARADVWGPGLALAAVLAVVIRPAVVGACLAGTGLSRGERRFVQMAGLKGAVPILLGGYILATAVGDAQRYYGIVVVVVIFSVVVQGGLVEPAISRLGLPVEA